MNLLNSGVGTFVMSGLSCDMEKVSQSAPHMTTHQRDRVYEGRRGLGIPGGGAGLGRPLLLQQMSRDGDLFVSPPHLLTVSLRGRQGSQDRQRPCPTRPGYGGQPHQAYPTQAGCLDEMTCAGAHCVTIDTLGLDPPATPPLQGPRRSQTPAGHRPDRGVGLTGAARHGLP